MKKILILSFIAFGLKTQAQVNVVTENKDMRKGNQPCYELAMDDVVYKDVKKAWMKKLDGFTKSKPFVEDLDMEFYNSIIPSFNFDSLNVYCRVLQRDQAVVIQSFFESNQGFVSDSNDAKLNSPQIKTFLNDFGKEMYNGFYLKKVGVESKVLKKKMGDLDDLNDLIANKTKLIKKRETGIRNNKSDISNAVKEIEVNKNEVLNQSSTVSKISATDPSYKSASKKLKSLQKKGTKLLNKKASWEKEIGKFHSQIEDAKNVIAKTKSDIIVKEEEIKTQNKVLDDLNAKII